MVTVAQLRRHIGELLRLQTLTAAKVEQLLQILQWERCRDNQSNPRCGETVWGGRGHGICSGHRQRYRYGHEGQTAAGSPTRQQLKDADIGASDLETSSEEPAPKRRRKLRTGLNLPYA